MRPPSTGCGRCTGRSLTLLVANARGWESLCTLITRAHAHTRSGAAGARAQAPALPIADVLSHAEGLICLSGCALHGIHDEATLRRLREAFGRERLFVELQRPYLRGDRARNRALDRIGARLELRTVATGGVHAHTPLRALLADALIAVRSGLALDESEALRPANHTHVLASPRAMAARFAEHPQALCATAAIVREVDFDLLSDLRYHYPGAERADAARSLAQACGAALAERYPPQSRHHAAARQRLEEELRVIDALGLSGFFLLHHELLCLAREVALEVRGPGGVRSLLSPGRGRGSSVSSIVCYLTGLSHIDPIAADLQLQRFLHEQIERLPDIDIDFPRDIRARLILRIHERYGRERSALVGAYSTYRTRGAIRDLGKALALPAGELERLARAVDGASGGEIAADVRRLFGHRGQVGVRWRWLARLVPEAYGLPRHLSQHPGGMVISTRPLPRLCPVLPAAMAGRQILQWDKDSCADAGFLKIDLLGLGMLSALEGCLELIERRSAKRIDLSRISYEDRRTFAAIRRADTTGVFQIESRAQMSSLLRTRPRNLAELAIQVAIVRPGPIVGGAVNPYLRRLQRKRADPDFKPPSLHPSLEQPLSETLGVIIFQDQVIAVACAFAGFDAGEAEGLRRAMSRKRSAQAIARYRERFIAGAMRKHEDVRRPLAERVFAMIESFSGFGFPKAHAAAFGLLAYQSAWLRVHHPAEFLCALLNAQPTGFYAPDALINEARRGGARVRTLRADVNASELDCTVEQSGAVRLGLRFVKGMAEVELRTLLAARKRGGPFDSLADLASRSGLRRSSLLCLARAGAIPRPLAASRRQALYRLGASAGAQARGRHSGRQPALALELPPAPPLRRAGRWEELRADYATLGTGIGCHPLALLRAELARAGMLSTAELAGVAHGTRIALGGLVIARQRPQSARGTMFLLLEDEQGTLNVIIARALYEANRPLLRSAPLLVVEGRLERHPAGGGGLNLIASAFHPLAVPSSRAESRAPSGEADTTVRQLRALRAHLPAPVHFAAGRRR
jgi:error-prone DNA polymerase